MSSIDQQFIEYIVKSLVGKPDAVKIDRRIDEKGVLLELTVDPEDLGRVIGKRGATAQSLRTLLRALGTKNEARYNLKIIDNGEPRPPREDRDEHGGDYQRHEDQGSASASAPMETEDVESNQPETEEPEPAEEPKEKSSASSDLELDDEEEAPEKEASDKLKKTRQELNDLDDLDI